MLRGRPESASYIYSTNKNLTDLLAKLPPTEAC